MLHAYITHHKQNLTPTWVQIFQAYQKSGTQEPKVEPEAQDPKVGP